MPDMAELRETEPGRANQPVSIVAGRFGPDASSSAAFSRGEPGPLAAARGAGLQYPTLHPATVRRSIRERIFFVSRRRLIFAFSAETGARFVSLPQPGRMRPGCRANRNGPLRTAPGSGPGQPGVEQMVLVANVTPGPVGALANAACVGMDICASIRDRVHAGPSLTAIKCGDKTTHAPDRVILSLIVSRR